MVEIQIFESSDAEGRLAFEVFKANNSNLIVRDLLESQLKCYLEILLASKQQDESKVEFVKNQLALPNSERNANWVFYPWKNEAVRILDEEAFIVCRTSRNQYKIQPSEQYRLHSKTIGVVGLSVGHAIACSIALERICSEIRIADFDTLELTNLNRIRTSLLNLGMSKSEIVYREVKELDPYIKVVCFPQGLNEDNIDEFIGGKSSLDLIIEECDSIDIKLLIRERAKSKGVPVVMEMSDRGMLDIERYDLNPSYPIFHGLVPANTNYALLKSLKTSEEKMPYMLPIVGVETLSPRMKASLMEIGKTLDTWPQLGSDVLFGGALVTNVSRRLLLGEALSSGRFWLGLDDHFDGAKGPELGERSFELRRLTEVRDYDSFCGPNEHLMEILNAARTSPSAGNMQPWKFSFASEVLTIQAIELTDTSFSDVGRFFSKLSVGMVLRNIEIESGVLGYEVDSVINESEGCATVKFKRGIAKVDPIRSTVRARKTERVCHQRGRLSESQRSALNAFVGTDFNNVLVEDPSEIDAIGNLVGQGDRIRLLNKVGHSEFFTRELRWSREEASLKGDGLDITLFGLAEKELLGLRLAKDPEAVETLRRLKLGDALADISPKGFSNAAGVLIVIVKPDMLNEPIRIGRELQQLWLLCTKEDIYWHPCTVLQNLFLHLHFDSAVLDKDEKEAALKLREQLSDITSINEQVGRSVFLTKLYVAPDAQPTSQRLPLF
jgi:molybdopterin/thiamine biosynthesis adenylyltransferase